MLHMVDADLEPRTIWMLDWQLRSPTAFVLLDIVQKWIILSGREAK